MRPMKCQRTLCALRWPCRQHRPAPVRHSPAHNAVLRGRGISLLTMPSCTGEAWPCMQHHLQVRGVASWGALSCCAVIPPYMDAVDSALSYLAEDGFVGVTDFFTSGKFDLPNRCAP